MWSIAFQIERYRVGIQAVSEKMHCSSQRQAYYFFRTARTQNVACMHYT